MLRIYSIWQKFGLKYVILAGAFGAILLLGSLTGAAAQEDPDTWKTVQPSLTSATRWALAEKTATPDYVPAAQATPVSADAADQSVFLPIIFKQIDNLLIPPVCIASEFNPLACRLPTRTPTPTPTHTPFGTPPGYGTPTPTPIFTETKAPTLTNTPTAVFILLPNGDFEDGPFWHWIEYSRVGHPIILKENPTDDDDQDLELPIPVFGNWGAWLGGDDNEYSYIEQQDVYIPLNTAFLGYAYYIHSYDRCGSELFPPVIYDSGGIQINGTDISFDFPGCTHELCTPKIDGNSWNGLIIHLPSFGFSLGQPITVRFWADTDYSLTSSLFIDNVVFQNRFDLIYSGMTTGPTGFAVQRIKLQETPTAMDYMGLVKTISKPAQLRPGPPQEADQ